MAFVANLDVYQSQLYQAVRPGVTSIFAAGRGSGKTWLLALLIHVLALAKKRKIALVMPSLKQARHVFWYPHLLPAVQTELKKCVRHHNQTEMSIDYVNGSRLETWGFENAGSIRGERFDAIIEDETDDMSKELEAAILQPTLSRSGRDAVVVKAGTYTRGRSGILYRDMQFARKGEPGYFGLTVTSEDSPQVDKIWLSTKVKPFTDPRVYDREYLCNPDSAEGLVYPLFTERTHCCAPHPQTRWDQILVGVDWGWNHPGAFIIVGVSGAGLDKTLHVLEEVYASFKEQSWWLERAKELKLRYPRAHWYADPSRPDGVETLRRHAHVNIEPASNDVDGGIATVADTLVSKVLGYGEHGAIKRPTLLVDKDKCPNLVREFGLYRWKRNAKVADQHKDEPEKINDDAEDALRYALHSHFCGEDGRRFESGPGVLSTS